MAERSAITDVAGVRVGHAQRIGDGWLTGVTVVLPPPGTRGAVDVRGAAPGTHETDALRAGAVAPYPQAIVLTGGSAYGLAAATGVQLWCAERGLGHRVGPAPHEVVPIVPTAAIFDLGRGGTFTAWPDAALGREAAEAAAAASGAEPVARGTVGAGTGATLVDETFKGGVGTASMTTDLVDGQRAQVGAIVVVNAFGSPRTTRDATVPAPSPDPPSTGAPGTDRARTSPPLLNTSLVVLATDVALDEAQLARLAGAGHDGLARAIDPVHTLADGDTVFALSTDRIPLPARGADLASARPWRDSVLAVQAAGAHAVELAVRDAVVSANAVRTPVLDLPRFTR